MRLCSTIWKSILSFVAVVGATEAFAGGAAVEFVNYYGLLLENVFGLEGHALHDWMATAGALFTLLIVIVLGLRYKAAVEKDLEAATLPDTRFSVRTVVEMILEFVHNLGEGLIGAKHAKAYYPLLAGLFVFIFISNLSGLVPGFLPATDSINTNLAMGITVFLCYNYAGIKEHGGSYVKQFMGPVLLMAPLFIIIEIIGHFARPVSLSLRLLGNIFGDHLVLSVFTGLTFLVLPAALLFFGLLVATLQSVVFTLLTGIYISMAVSHDH